MKLPKAEQNLPEWQTAIGRLIGAAEARDFLLHARIGMLRALNRDGERVFDPERKDHNWGSGSWRGINDARLEMKEAAN